MTPNPRPFQDGLTSAAILGWLSVLGIMTALWLARSEPTSGQTSPQPQPSAQVLTAPTATTEPNVLKFSLNLSEPDDLKVRQGDQVAAGDVLADRTRERSQLLVQQRKIQLSLQQIQGQQILEPPPPLPVPPVSELPPVAYQPQAAAIAEVEGKIELQQRKMDLLATLPPDQVPPAMREHEERLLEQLYQELEAAQAALKAAQERTAYQAYEHSLAMARRAEEANQQQLAYSQQRQQAAQQRRDKAFQEAQLQTQLQAIEVQLMDLSTIRSPYGGTIRRIKWLGQTDNRLTVEITLAVGLGQLAPSTPAALPVPTAPQPSPGAK